VGKRGHDVRRFVRPRTLGDCDAGRIQRHRRNPRRIGVWVQRRDKPLTHMGGLRKTKLPPGIRLPQMGQLSRAVDQR
jgi:hypothetical protein